MTRYTVCAPATRPAPIEATGSDDTTAAAFFDVASPAALPGRGAVRSGSATLYGRSPFAHSICVQPRGDGRKPFAAGIARVRTTPREAASELCDRLSDPSMEADAAVHGDSPLFRVCDSGYGIAPGTATDEGNAVEDCTPALRMRSERKTVDGRRKGRRMTAAYIALEGPDGVGKSTVASALRELLLRRTRPTAYSDVRIRHFPTDALTACADNGGYRPKAEDYAGDMENWLSFRPEPVPTPASNEERLYILDRWALSTAVYASLRNERISESVALTLNRLNRVPLTTFVLTPRAPAELTDPDYPDPDGYDPVAVTEAYRAFLTNAFVAGETSGFIPIVVDRTADAPDSVAAEIAGRLTELRRGM